MEKVIETLSTIIFDGSKLSIVQLVSLRDFSPDKLKSLTEELQSISNADYDAFDALKIQEYANAFSNLEPKQVALLLSTQIFSKAKLKQVLSVQKLTPELINRGIAEADLLSSKQKLSVALVSII